jgi:hypothetical protein
VVDVDSRKDAQIIDDDGNMFNTAAFEDYEFTVFRRVREKKPQYREVKRPAKVGERIRIVNTSRIEHRYSNGDEGIVTRDWGENNVRALINGEDCGVVYSEYVVLEPIEDAKEKRLTVGDFAKVVNTERLDSAIRVGDIFEIMEDDESMTPYFAERITDGRRQWFKAERLVRATDEEVAQARQEAEERAKWQRIGRKVGELREGDIVRVKNALGAGVISVGDIVTVAETDGTNSPLVYTKGGDTQYATVELVCPVESRFDNAERG